MTAQQLLSMDYMENTPLPGGNEQMIIQGISVDNKVFRPSDWVERISASMAVFGRDNKLRYSNYVQPCVIDGLKCMIVAKGLSAMNPAAYDFIMGFAHANNLRICEDRRQGPKPVGDDRREQEWDYPLKKQTPPGA
jgi:hypothetical protein